MRIQNTWHQYAYAAAYILGSVEGPRSRLVKSFKHFACDITGYPAKNEVKVEIWFGLSKHTARWHRSGPHQEHDLGVTKFKMKFVYAH